MRSGLRLSLDLDLDALVQKLQIGCNDAVTVIQSLDE